MRRSALALLLAGLAPAMAPAAERFDIVIRGGTVYDGTGAPPRRADVGLRGDRVVALGDLSRAEAGTVLDASGLAVAPGFINMLSWSTESLLVDGRSQGEIRQGVTTEIFGEGESFGPWNAEMKRLRKEGQGDVQYDIAWTTLAEYLAHLEKKGISPNVASYIGATTVREHVVGPGRPPGHGRGARGDARARAPGDGGGRPRHRLVAHLRAGDLRVHRGARSSSARPRRPISGKYISHMRSEGDRLAGGGGRADPHRREAQVPAEIYHLKAGGQGNWPKMDAVIAKVEAARREGLKITADMYTYTAGATGFDACLPPWAHDGGPDAVFARLQDPTHARAHRRRDQDARPGLGEPVRPRREPRAACSCSSSRATP